jgi:hypothetical protein
MSAMDGNGNTLVDRVATRLMSLETERNEARAENQQLREKIASLSRRNRAEDVLIRALQSPDAPQKLKVASLEEFLAKRAALETEDDEYIEKMAMLIDLCDDPHGFEVSDFSSEDTYGDFGAWLASQSS